MCISIAKKEKKGPIKSTLCQSIQLEFRENAKEEDNLNGNLTLIDDYVRATD